MATEAEKVEMEQVPLKTDTDEKPAEKTEEKVEKPKKSWFFKKEKKIATEEGEKTEEKTEKKRCFFNRCKKDGDEKQMSIGIDMQMRDEKNLNDHVKLQFEDVFGEPDTFHSWDCAWRVVYRVFEFTRVFFYRLFALIICVPAAFIFGILLAFLSALNVFVIVPIAKLASIPLTWLSVAWNFLVTNILSPLTHSLGNIFSRISVRNYGINNAPTDLIQA